MINTLNREDILGELFYTGGMGYYAQLMGLNHISALNSQAHHQLLAGYGTFGYEPNVSYLYGVPSNIHQGGIAMDIPVVFSSAVNNGDPENRCQFNIQMGMTVSTLEHLTPEQMFPPIDPNKKPDAISAVKALQKANTAGQRIYLITRDNLNTVLPQLHHSAEVLSDIRRSVNAGKEVTTHTDAVSIPGGWSGFGYIVLDPVTGDGAYRISGGGNGSELPDSPGNFQSVIWGIIIGGAIGVMVVSYTAAIVVIVLAALITVAFLQAVVLNDEEEACLVVGIFLGTFAKAIGFALAESSVAAIREVALFIFYGDVADRGDKLWSCLETE